MVCPKTISNSSGVGKATLWTSISTKSTNLTTYKKRFISTPCSTHPTIWRRRLRQPPQFHRPCWYHQTRRMAGRDLQRVFAQSWVRFGNQFINITTFQHGIGCKDWDNPVANESEAGTHACPLHHRHLSQKPCFCSSRKPHFPSFVALPPSVV